MDYDDALHLRKLCRDFEDKTVLLNECLKLVSELELALDMGIVDEDVSDRLSWKKNCLELIKKNDSYKQVYMDFLKTKTQIKVCQTALKSIENEINCIKKTLDVTPK